MFVNRIVLTAKFAEETNALEPTGGGHTALWNMFKPVASLSVTDLRAVLLTDLIRGQGLGLADAAVAFGAWLDATGLVPDGITFTPEEVRSACVPHLHARIQDPFARVADCYWEMHRSDIGRESRVPEFIVPLAEVPQGRSKSAPVVKAHPEHVVPMAFIRDQCLALLQERYQDGEEDSRASALTEMAELVRRWLVVVHVSDEEWRALDEGPDSLKQVMPADWSPETGCLFARLHRLKIPFEMNADVGSAWRCTCSSPSTAEMPANPSS